MKILLTTHLFAPSIGGIETMSLLLAREFVARGHEVHVVTATTANRLDDDRGLTVVRRPGPFKLAREVVWCDVCFHNNISLSYCWPLLLCARPWVVTTQTWILRSDGTRRWREHLKRLLLRRTHAIAISRAIADSLPVPSAIIPNCYDSDVFRTDPTGTRSPSRDLIFVGRLVSDKGADLALEALARLAAAGLHPSLTIVGDGPERSRLQSQVSTFGIAAQVTFAGALQGDALADALRDHRIQLVPSRWPEPFGIVALEGAACGCLVLGSAGGGLGDAIGPCGATFPNGDARALAEAIAAALRGEFQPADAARCAHLRRHNLSAIVDAYLALFADLAPNSGKGRPSRLTS